MVSKVGKEAEAEERSSQSGAEGLPCTQEEESKHESTRRRTLVEGHTRTAPSMEGHGPSESVTLVTLVAQAGSKVHEGRAAG